MLCVLPDVACLVVLVLLLSTALFEVLRELCELLLLVDTLLLLFLSVEVLVFRLLVPVVLRVDCCSVERFTALLLRVGVVRCSDDLFTALLLRPV